MNSNQNHFTVLFAELTACLMVAACGGASGVADELTAAAGETAAAADSREEAERLRIFYDNIPPTLTITDGDIQGLNVRAEGNVSDNVGVKRVTWSVDGGLTGTATLNGPLTSPKWTVSGIKLHPGSNLLTFHAVDLRGNTAKVAVNVPVPNTQPPAPPAPSPAPAPKPPPPPPAPPPPAPAPPPPAPAPPPPPPAPPPPAPPAPAPAPTPPAPPPPAPAPSPPGPTAFSDACSRFYSSTFQLSSTKATDPIASRSKPVKGAAFADPAYKTCVVRGTDHASEPPSGFARNDYSRRQAFNANSSRYIVYSNNGFWHVYDAKTLAHYKQLSGPAGDAEPQWHSTNPDLLYYVPTNGIGMKVYELNVVTGQTRTLGDLSARLRARWSSANAAWMKSEGSPSADGRYWCFMVDTASWNSVGVVTWDRDTDTVLGMIDTNGERPDHVSMSPSGNYCVVSGDGARGTVAYSRDMKTQRKVLHKSEHSDIAIDANGDDVYVSVDFQSNAGDLFMVNLRTGVRTLLFPTYISGTATALHISGKGYRKPGWVVVSTYAEYGSMQWPHRKVFALQLTANPKVLNLAHHHSRPNGYWTEPHATVNRDFTKVLFNSNWDSGSDIDVDAYMIDLPQGVIK